MRLVGVACLGKLGVVAQIVVAIGHAEARLAEIDRIGVRVLVVDADAEADRSVELQARIADRGGHIVQRLQMRDHVEVGFRCGDPLRVELLLIDEAVVKIAQLLLFDGQRIVGLRFERRHDLLHALFAQDAQVLEGAGGGAIGRNLRGLVPATAGVHEKIVTRLHALVHGGRIETPGPVFGLCRVAIRACRSYTCQSGKRYQTPSHSKSP